MGILIRLRVLRFLWVYMGPPPPPPPPPPPTLGISSENALMYRLALLLISSKSRILMMLKLKAFFISIQDRGVI
ncbi:hypothetical protein DHODJN_25960 [Methylorubrum extorquens]